MARAHCPSGQPVAQWPLAKTSAGPGGKGHPLLLLSDFPPVADSNFVLLSREREREREREKEGADQGPCDRYAEGTGSWPRSWTRWRLQDAALRQWGRAPGTGQSHGTCPRALGSWTPRQWLSGSGGPGPQEPRGHDKGGPGTVSALVFVGSLAALPAAQTRPAGPRPRHSLSPR